MACTWYTDGFFGDFPGDPKENLRSIRSDTAGQMVAAMWSGLRLGRWQENRQEPAAMTRKKHGLLEFFPLSQSLDHLQSMNHTQSCHLALPVLYIYSIYIYIHIYICIYIYIM